MSKIIKVPLVMQMEITECGAACLTMILEYYGKWIPLEEVRGNCGVNRDGANLNNISRSAQFYGFDTKAKAIGIKGLKKANDYPCILFWDFNHYVVLTGFRGNYAYLNDPTKGKVKIPLEIFKKKYSGVTLFLKKTDRFQPEGKPLSMVQYAARQLKGSGDSISIVMITSTVVLLAAIINTVISGVYIDKVLSERAANWLWPILTLCIAVSLVSGIAAIINAVYTVKSEGKVALSSSSAFMWHLLHLPIRFYEQRSIGDIQKRQIENETLTFTLIGQLAPLVINITMLVVFVLVMLGFSPMLTLVGVSVAIFNAVIGWVISSKRVNLSRSMISDDSKLFATTIGGAKLIETIKTTGTERIYFEKWAGYQASVNETNVQLKDINEKLGAIPQAAIILANSIILMQCIILIMDNEFTPGMSLAAITLFSLIINPINQLIQLGQTIQEMRTQMERIDDVMKYPADVPESEAEEQEHHYKDMDDLMGPFEMKKVTFGYSPSNPPLIEDFNLHLEPGQWVALVGSSGSGKSTIGKLITGIYPVWSGEISFNGVPIENIPRGVLRNSLGMISQEVVSFEDSISNNVRLLDKSIKDYEIIMACIDADIHEDIIKRPGGYNATISSGGSNFSGGQMQRIEIARTLSRNPNIMVLDEATSALDAKTEELVMKKIRRQGVTCVVISHRLSTIRDCDEIIVMNEGKIVERGTHDELINKQGKYYDLVKEG